MFEWNKDHIGNLEGKADKLDEDIATLQRIEEDRNLNSEETMALRNLNKEYMKTLKQVETKWA